MLTYQNEHLMKWRKIGRVLNPEILSEYGISACTVPIVQIENESEGLIKVYFSPRDNNNRSELRYFIFNIKTFEITRISETLFSYGSIGSFDEMGVTVCSIIECGGGERRVYYQGWTLGVSVPSITAIGVAIINEEDRVCRIGDGPILSRSLNEPYSCGSPFVLIDEGKYKMWYSSMDKWIDEGGDLKHYYDIKYAESIDGVNWIRSANSMISYENSEEYAFGRPFVIKEDSIYKMWYSYRGKQYKIGYAESTDGINWKRKDELVGIDISDTGWDADMIEYATIFDFDKHRYMLYNGNDFGKSGIGLAVLESNE